MALFGRGKLTRSLSGPYLKGMLMTAEVPRGLAIMTKGVEDKTWPEAAVAGAIMTTAEGLTN